MINIYDGVMDTNLVIPRGVDRTEVIFDYYFADVSEQATEAQSREHRRQRADSDRRRCHLRVRPTRSHLARV